MYSVRGSGTDLIVGCSVMRPGRYLGRGDCQMLMVASTLSITVGGDTHFAPFSVARPMRHYFIRHLFLETCVELRLTYCTDFSLDKQFRDACAAGSATGPRAKSTGSSSDWAAAAKSTSVCSQSHATHSMTAYSCVLGQGSERPSSLPVTARAELAHRSVANLRASHRRCCVIPVEVG